MTSFYFNGYFITKWDADLFDSMLQINKKYLEGKPLLHSWKL